ncbi:FG-GAP repeat domain-containing protein, partial [Tropicimonas aquimaris]
MSYPYIYQTDFYNTSVREIGVSTGDYDNDGLSDVVVGNYSQNSVTVWEYDPSVGGLVAQTTYSGFVNNIHDATLADIDEDGIADIIASTRFYSLHAQLSSTGTKPVLDGAYSWQVIAEDFDGDGHIDLFSGIDGGFSNMLYGNGDGTFTFGPEPAQVVPGSRGVGYNAVDLNADGLLDLIGFQTAGGVTRLAAYLNQSVPGTPAWSGNIAA